MQVVSNTTGMQAGVAVATDKHGRDHCVVVVKGTFRTDERGVMRLSEKQRPLVYIDEHYGDPETTSVRYECEFAPWKPHGEVLVEGWAISGRPVRRARVRLEMPHGAKEIEVFGDRVWTRGVGRLVPSEPRPFTEMPLVRDRAFGGQDDSRGPERVAVEQRNLHGVGYHPYRSISAIRGAPLPNLEHPRQLMVRPRDHPDPIGFGVVPRVAPQRVAFAGTYDEHWLEDVYPFLPADFDDRYFMSAPQDQWCAHFVGGERFRCVNMAHEHVVQFVLPTLRVPVRFAFARRSVVLASTLDTVILEPHLHLATLHWRASVPLGKKLHALEGVLVGQAPDEDGMGLIGYRRGKPVFRGADAAIRWIRRNRGGSR